MWKKQDEEIEQCSLLMTSERRANTFCRIFFQEIKTRLYTGIEAMRQEILAVPSSLATATVKQIAAEISTDNFKASW